MTGEFSGLGLAVGVVRGARAFDVDALGRLTGVSYPQVWTPFENVAECRAPKTSSTNIAGAGITWAILDEYVSGPRPGKKKVPKVVEPVVEPEPEPHSMEKCKCGFYGYYDGSNDYRADEARDVAAPNYSGGGIYSFTSVYSTKRVPARVCAVVEGYGETIIGTRGFRASKARIVALFTPEGLDPHLMRRVRHNYREIPFFESFDQMVAEFPTDMAESGTTPETDPEFWVRAI